MVDTVDDEVINNILNELPLQFAFDAGKTNMHTAVSLADAISQRWRRGSAVFLLVGDGDTLPAEETAQLTGAFRSSLVVGVGNPHRGTFIDDHSSRQDARSLQQLAARLRGKYVDANTLHVSSRNLQQLSSSPMREKRSISNRNLALAILLFGSFCLTGLPLALDFAGGAQNLPAPDSNRE